MPGLPPLTMAMALMRHPGHRQVLSLVGDVVGPRPGTEMAGKHP